jgi:hypothetical protein
MVREAIPNLSLPYDVAKMLRETIDTVEKHYATFTKEFRDRVRRIMESREGSEKISCAFGHTHRVQKRAKEPFMAARVDTLLSSNRL